MGTSTIERIERFVLAASGKKGTEYSISIFLPTRMSADVGSKRVLFVLDADMVMGMVSEIVESASTVGEIEPAIVVGIGYGGDLMQMAKLRTKDFTPPLDPANSVNADALVSLIGNDRGGAERFLSFILDELSPEIVRRYPQASITGNLILGHSLGGLFVSYALLNRPEAFSSFLISSPSLWWDDFAVLGDLLDLPSKLNERKSNPTVFIGVGALEQDIPQRPPATALAGIDLKTIQALVANARMVDAAQEFSEALHGAGLPNKFSVFEERTHNSVLPGMISGSLFLALASNDS